MATQPLPEAEPKAAVERLAGGPVEACSDYRGTLVACRFHPLVGATWTAFNDHRPLALTPDVIWLTIAQGIAIPINQHSETLRRHFVAHEGRTTLSVRRDDFVKGSPENPWAEVIGEFSRQIREQIGPRHAWIMSDFSTTGPVERVASEVVLMEAMQNYFEYEVHTLCGIPSITLEGTAEDWDEIRSRLDGLDELGLSRWSEALRPILDQFVSAARGRPDRAFWGSIFKVKGESGGPYLTGWLARLFPYLQHAEYEPAPSFRRTGRRVNYPNPYLDGDSGDQPFGGVKADHLPSPLSKVLFKWKYLDTELDYEFIAGLIGIEQDGRTMTVRPKIGWAVRAV